MDIYETDQIEEFEEFEGNKDQPTLEQIKKIVDSKRQKITKARAPSKTYTKEDRIKNLELARERKKTIEPKQKKKDTNQSQTEPKPDILPTIDNNTFNNEAIINELKFLAITQNEILEKLKTETKPKKQRKPKIGKKDTKTLDLTITDDEIKNIIEKQEIGGTKQSLQKQELQEQNLKLIVTLVVVKYLVLQIPISYFQQLLNGCQNCILLLCKETLILQHI